MTNGNIFYLPTPNHLPDKGPLPDEFGPRFEVIDAERSYATAALNRFVMDAFSWTEVLDYRDFTWKSLPLRLVHDSAGGWQIECGPFNFDDTAIANLREILAAYDQAIGR